MKNVKVYVGRCAMTIVHLSFKFGSGELTRVSVETGSSTGLLLFNTYKHFSRRRISTDHEC